MNSSRNSKKNLQFDLSRQIFKVGQVFIGIYFLTQSYLFIMNPTSESAVGWNISRKSYIFNEWTHNGFDSEAVRSKIIEGETLSKQQLDGSSRFQKFLGNVAFKLIGLLYLVIGMLLITSTSKNVAMYAVFLQIFWCIFGDGNYWLIQCDPYVKREKFGFSLMFKQWAVVGAILLYSVNSRAKEDSVCNLFGLKQITAGSSRHESLRNAFRG